jgi:ADP-ribose pyrophosphatase YjhB (NUDIX family)
VSGKSLPLFFCLGVTIGCTIVGVYTKNTYCSYCGRPFHPEHLWPRSCSHCHNTTFLNPTPVAVILQPVGEGLLAVRRGIEPGLGKLALPGGYIELRESWQTAAARELHEETGIRIDPAAIRLFDVHDAEAADAAEAGVIIIFGLAPPVPFDSLASFQPTPDAAELVILSETAEMPFSLHQQVVTTYFNSRKKPAPSGRSFQPAFS